MTLGEAWKKFPVGTKVRLRDGVRKRVTKAREGRVVDLWDFTDGRVILFVDRGKGVHAGHKEVAWNAEECVLAENPYLDSTCDMLVRAYQDGDREACLMLAERIFELMGATVASNKEQE